MSLNVAVWTELNWHTNGVTHTHSNYKRSYSRLNLSVDNGAAEKNRHFGSQ